MEDKELRVAFLKLLLEHEQADMQRLREEIERLEGKSGNQFDEGVLLTAAARTDHK